MEVGRFSFCVTCVRVGVARIRLYRCNSSALIRFDGIGSGTTIIFSRDGARLSSFFVSESFRRVEHVWTQWTLERHHFARTVFAHCVFMQTKLHRCHFTVFNRQIVFA